MTDKRNAPNGQEGGGKKNLHKDNINISNTDGKADQGMPSRLNGKDQSSGDRLSRTTMQVLSALAERLTPFHDAEGRAYVSVRVNGHTETWPARGQQTSDYLRSHFFYQERCAPSNDALQAALNQIEAKARFEGEEHLVHTRVAHHGGAIYVDLCNEPWQVVRIGKDGWSIVDDPPIKFVRSQHMKSLPTPIRGGDIGLLKRFGQFSSEEDDKLYAGAIISYFCPGPHFILALLGMQGSGKTTRARNIRNLVDPTSAHFRTFPKEAKDLLAALNNSYMLCFDNSSGLTTSQADVICQLVSGSGVSARQMYTLEQETVFTRRVPIVINGIPGDTVSRDDLNDRAIVLFPEGIPPTERRTEEELAEEFEDIAAYIFGVICDALSCALRRFNEVKARARAEKWELPRMADAALWVTAAESALGWEDGAFIDAYWKNRQASAQAAVDASTVGSLISKYIDKYGCFEGGPGRLLDELHKFNSSLAKPFSKLPTDVAVLGKEFARIMGALRDTGLLVDGKKTASGRIYTISRDDGSEKLAPVVLPKLGGN